VGYGSLCTHPGLKAKSPDVSPELITIVSKDHEIEQTSSVDHRAHTTEKELRRAASDLCESAAVEQQWSFAWGRLHRLAEVCVVEPVRYEMNVLLSSGVPGGISPSHRRGVCDERIGGVEDPLFESLVDATAEDVFGGLLDPPSAQVGVRQGVRKRWTARVDDIGALFTDKCARAR
jgi:hypothetical protein